MENKQIQLDITDDTFQSDYPHISILCDTHSPVSTECIDHGGTLHHVAIRSYVSH